MGQYHVFKQMFEQLSDKAIAGMMQAYMRDQFLFYGLHAPERKSVYKDFLRSEKKSKRLNWGFLDECWDDDYREFQYLVVDYLGAMRRFLKYEDVALMERYIQTKQWWDTIDGLSVIIGDIAFTDLRMEGLMLDWSTSPDFWVRRVAIDHQLCRKGTTNTALLEAILVNNLGSSEFFINKAIGWSLRNYSKTNPEWVRAFLDRYGGRMSSLSVREAGKYL